ncbi:hypothetical protein G3567_13020 [Psychroflexus sp. YR1-1]|uniref:DUF4145 domain-containing protein n=1 Tax=Psychroflexus aurantiacus TaxID=2709310 RepID=A0A6B3R310_9FLAO|nr:hypothetical protein [Psychroflexus aurantiacus]NEV95059.1 hypothetical protein [Psychroflexus aurantiacus]
MYINFHKFNYETIPASEKSRYEERDKEAYKAVIGEWFNSNLDNFVNRKWEIEEIHYLKEISDFIKLIREAESLYELGFFTGCIALVGVSAEDFSKYLSVKNNRPNHITDTYTSGRRRGQAYDVSQFNRLKMQLNEGIIDQNTYDLLDEIRSIRNDCLHYNQSFKQKSTNDLKVDSLKALNNLKLVLKDNIGTNPDPNDFQDLMNELFKSENHRSFEEIVWKQKNMFSHLLKFSTTQDPGVKQVVKVNFYQVTDLDDEEVELKELEENSQLGTNLIVWVDIDEAGRELIEKKSIQKGDYVFAEVYSDVAEDGQTRIWYIRKIEKITLHNNS